MRSVFERARFAGQVAWAFAVLAVACLTAEAQLAEVRSIPSAEIHNFFALPSGIYSGSAPDSEKAFEELKALGIKTVLSVDGSLPNVELAHKYGIRYIHLPIGYNGTTTSNANRLVKAASAAKGPIFVHCHHGKHRGPAAAAVMCEGTGAWKADQALKWLETAGTAAEYTGLFKMVKEFVPPSKATLEELPSTFPELVRSSGVVDGMVEVDERMDHLKALQKVGYGPLPGHPDVEASHEALLLAEGFRELLRHEESAKHGEDFMRRMKEAETAASELHLYLKKHRPQADFDKQAADKLLARSTQNCTSCHKDFRNK